MLKRVSALFAARLDGDCPMRIKILLLALLLPACTELVGQGPFGNNPSGAGSPPTNYVENSRIWILAQLKNRDSLAQFSAGRPEFGSCEINPGTTFNGWRVPVTYSIRRSAGGNSGTKTIHFWYAGETMSRVSAEPDSCPPGMLDPG